MTSTDVTTLRVHRKALVHSCRNYQLSWTVWEDVQRELAFPPLPLIVLVYEPLHSAHLYLAKVSLLPLLLALTVLLPLSRSQLFTLNLKVTPLHKILRETVHLERLIHCWLSPDPQVINVLFFRIHGLLTWYKQSAHWLVFGCQLRRFSLAKEPSDFVRISEVFDFRFSVFGPICAPWRNDQKILHD